MTQVVVLNGGSSSGKTSVARALQRLLPGIWMTLGVDDLIRALPGGDALDDVIQTQGAEDGAVAAKGSVIFGPDGSVAVGDEFRRTEAAWYAGLAAIGRSGVGLIVDEVFMSGGASQKRLAAALSDLTVVWVGVRCDPAVAEERERGRPDRIVGMARRQAARVHAGVVYDVVVDTSSANAADCASVIADHVATLHASCG